MSIYYVAGAVTLHAGDCLDVLRELPDASVDAVVTDPPYGLGFMGKEWDNAAALYRPPSAAAGDSPLARFRTGKGPAAVAFDGIAFQAWCIEWTTECLRVLKPGGHLLAFGGTRTWHRLACAVEDAGFEVRDSIAWLSGSGFPKSRNASRDLDGTRCGCPVPDERGSQAWGGWPVCGRCSQPVIPDGLGTALKPAFEPVVVARKPLQGTVAANVLAHGTGALNIDAARIEGEPWKAHTATGLGSVKFFTEGDTPEIEKAPHTAGRWPANVILDESQAAALDLMSGMLQSGANPTRRGSDKFRDAYGDFAGQEECEPARGADSGGASRFFYVAKADTSERVRVDGIAHPTVKPLALMRWLVRLVTPPGGTVLEPFAGSGTTVEACLLEGFRCIAIEREADYLPLIVQRINRRRDPVAAVKATGDDGGLFDLLDGGAA